MKVALYGGNNSIVLYTTIYSYTPLHVPDQAVVMLASDDSYLSNPAEYQLTSRVVLQLSPC